VATVVVLAPQAPSAPGMLIGLAEEPETLYGNPTATFPVLDSLHTQVLRLDLYWGGALGVAKQRPFDGADPNDPAYTWAAYDRVIAFANRSKIQVLLTIYGTPGWANGGKGLNVAPTSFDELRKFAFAAATRYSGTWTANGNALPAVHLWTAWNEPNNPVFLRPQYRRSGGRWVMQSARDYARICNAVYTGVHAALVDEDRVACGLTAPRGNNDPNSARPSVSPINFLQNLRKAGLKRFDAYAHHPYYTYPGETPTTKPKGARPRSTRITLGNIDQLIAEVTRLYGKRPLWITEYGYQTNPPDGLFGVSYAKQAAYLKQAFAIARKNPRIEMMLWFLLKDEPVISGWQSGLMTAGGKKKPAFTTFRRLRG
jgi:Glycosyl hydrolase catalytic core